VNAAEAVLLGVLQGLTEWLPISSSGHLAIAQHWIQAPVAFDIVVHVATTAVILLYFRKDIAGMARGMVKMDPGELRRVYLIGVGTVPTVISGLLLFRYSAFLMESLPIVGLCLMVTGCMLYATRYFEPSRKEREMTARDALIIGIFQGLAMLPGISRSGATISAGIYLGIRREDAGRFSFLLAVPAVLGAMVLELLAADWSMDLAVMAAGGAAAGVVGYLCLELLMKVLRGRNFHMFSYYCLTVGAATLLWVL